MTPLPYIQVGVVEFYVDGAIPADITNIVGIFFSLLKTKVSVAELAQYLSYLSKHCCLEFSLTYMNGVLATGFTAITKILPGG
jgi:hypothetical protein